MTTKDNNKGNQ